MDNELQLVENELVPVYETSTGEKVVNSKELWTILKSKSNFSTWLKFRLEECDAIENINYTRFHKKMEANNAKKIFDTDLAWEVYENLLDRYFYFEEKKEVQSAPPAPVFDDYIHKTFKFKSQDIEVLKIDDQLLFNMFQIIRCLEMHDEIIWKIFIK